MISSKQDLVWQARMVAARGKWIVDSIHNGKNRDFLCYLPEAAEDGICGIYVSIIGNRANAGYYSGAIPHIGDAIFTIVWQKEFTTVNEAFSRVLGRLGINLI
jgi:hypothetical protein